MCILLAASSRPAFADATLFVGTTTTPSSRTMKGFAIGVGVVVVWAIATGEISKPTSAALRGARYFTANVLNFYRVLIIH